MAISVNEGVTAQNITQLKSLISSGVLVPGAKLPAELDLCVAFGVSRFSLRHALKASEVMRNTLEDLLETRLIVEPEVAARAAERATLADLSVLRQTLSIAPDADQAEIIEADLRFHRGIFEAARNPICSRLFSLIHRSMARSIDLTSRMVDWNHTLEFHRPIYEAIERRSAGLAREAMIAHLSDARRLIGKINRSSHRLDLTTVIQPIAGTVRGGKRRKAR